MRSVILPVSQRRTDSEALTRCAGASVRAARSACPGRGRETLRAHFAAITETPLKHTAFENMTVYQTSDPEVIIAEHDAVGQVTNTGQPLPVRLRADRPSP